MYSVIGVSPRSVISVVHLIISFAHPPSTSILRIQSNFGCNHDRGTKNACSSSSYSYGYRDPGASFRSILAYGCKSGQCDDNDGGSCTRVQRFSNTEFQYNGKAIGGTYANNARRINDKRVEVANYYDSPTVSGCSYSIESTLMFAHLHVFTHITMSFCVFSTATSSYASTHKSSNTSP